MHHHKGISSYSVYLRIERWRRGAAALTQSLLYIVDVPYLLRPSQHLLERSPVTLWMVLNAFATKCDPLEVRIMIAEWFPCLCGSREPYQTQTIENLITTTKCTLVTRVYSVMSKLEKSWISCSIIFTKNGIFTIDLGGVPQIIINIPILLKNLINNTRLKSCVIN